MKNAHIDQYLVSNPSVRDITEKQLINDEINNDNPVKEQQVKAKQRRKTYREGEKAPGFEATYVKHEGRTKLQCTITRQNSNGGVDHCMYIQRESQFHKNHKHIWPDDLKKNVIN
ncbi:hypothetical protein M9Y10_022218 [Tritrichomonas musculus]|uniref:FLYWCH-type domain-containing protein n=1 Tax=Tritrichomonas musculus TaxID=1915356 RepID=A0ABR2GMK2_9EUKA